MTEVDLLEARTLMEDAYLVSLRASMAANERAAVAMESIRQGHRRVAADGQRRCVT